MIELGVTVVEDLSLLTEEDIDDLPVTRIERRKLLLAIEMFVTEQFGGMKITSKIAARERQMPHSH